MFIRYDRSGKNKYAQIVITSRVDSSYPKQKIIFNIGRLDKDDIPINKDFLIELATLILKACKGER